MAKTGLGRGLKALIPANARKGAQMTPAPVVTSSSVPANTAASQSVSATTPVMPASVVAAPAAQVVPASSPTPAAPGDAVLHLPLEKITADPNQPRKHFDHHHLEELMASIKEHGILQPLVVTPAGTDGKHMLIAGERRLRASTMLGLKKVPVLVRDVKEQERLALSIVENVQRADLNPIEEAMAYQRLMHEFNLTQDDVSKQVSKSRSAVANALRLLDLPIEVQQAVAEGKISSGHAKILASLDRPSEQKAYLERILKHQLTVRELEEQTKTVRKAHKPKSATFDPIREAQEELLRERLGTKTLIKKAGDKGQIIIHFYSTEELKRLLNELT